TFMVIGYMAWRGGRTYCNTICPVGTTLGFISKYSLFKVQFVDEKCNMCGLCAMKCKASCIDSKNKIIDHSRCVTCFNCIEVCNRSAMKYTIGRVLHSDKKEGIETITELNHSAGNPIN